MKADFCVIWFSALFHLSINGETAEKRQRSKWFQVELELLLGLCWNFSIKKLIVFWRVWLLERKNDARWICKFSLRWSLGLCWLPFNEAMKIYVDFNSSLLIAPVSDFITVMQMKTCTSTGWVKQILSLHFSY